MKLTASIYDDAGEKFLGTAIFDVDGCNFFCDRCGDCLRCYGDYCEGNCSFIIYENELKD